jgi:RNA polymerase sigma-70 factor (ECF subfamily)
MDKQLINRCRAGDAKAQRKLYEHFAARMYRVCYRYVKDELHAEDLLITGFARVLGGLGGFEYRTEGSLESWIRRIMVNESLMFLRKNNKLSFVAESKADAMEAGVTAEADLTAEEIYALVLRLPTGYRTVFNLYVVEGYSHQEIADQLNISENTSKSQLSKARAALREMLLKHGITQYNG